MHKLHKQWKGVFLRGIVAVIFGSVALFAPSLGFEIILLYFGAFAFIDGVFAFLIGLKTRSSLLILEGLVGIIVGAYVFLFTVQAATAFLLLVAVWAIASGIFEIVAGIELRRHVEREIWLLFAGIISILFGVFIFIDPVASVLAITFAIGIYAVIFGLFLILLSFKIASIPVKKTSAKMSSRKKKR